VAALKRGEPAGDCVDCHQCVAVCPTGVDIREGPNLGCIQCGLCIDACDNIMEKLDRPTRLIAYDTDLNIERRMKGEPTQTRIARPRTMLYAAVILLVGGIMLFTLATRDFLSLNVIHDRNPPFVILSDGGVRNAFTLRILNKQTEARSFAIEVSGLPGATLQVVGAVVDEAGTPIVDVQRDRTREFRATVTSTEIPGPEMTDLTFSVTDLSNGTTATRTDLFRSPGASR